MLEKFQFAIILLGANELQKYNPVEEAMDSTNMPSLSFDSGIGSFSSIESGHTELESQMLSNINIPGKYGFFQNVILDKMANT